MKKGLIINLTICLLTLSVQAGVGYEQITCKDKKGKIIAYINDDAGTGRSAMANLASKPGAKNKLPKADVLAIYVNHDFSLISAFATQKNNYVHISGTNAHSLTPQDGEWIRIQFVGFISTPGDFEVVTESGICEYSAL